jgi:hypothetical protein
VNWRAARIRRELVDLAKRYDRRGACYDRALSDRGLIRTIVGRGYQFSGEVRAHRAGHTPACRRAIVDEAIADALA